MKYYKDLNNNVYAYEDDGSQDHLIGDKIAMTSDEIDAHINPLGQVKAKKMSEITKAYNDAISTLVGNTDQYEMASWSKQEAEARAYIADNSVATPLLSGMVAARGLGESIADFAKKIIANADEYKISYATILGAYQAKQKAIAAATTVEQVETIK
jgi:hypothetical protein